MNASVTEIHRHPLRPDGFPEPLFLGRAAKKEIAEHLRASSGWLRRAGEARSGAPDATGELCHVFARPDGSAHLVRAARPGCPRRRSQGTPGCAKKSRVALVVERWREVRAWWEPDRATDRLCFRVQLAGGAVVDLALDRAGSWSLVRVLD